ncbi:acyltransferase [Flavobacterium soyae]|uniref:Acyltransferase n=1 Tax=Flavobacterium soyae TaxID=2903098 RepID=A0ABZ2UFI6_9FLAO
MPNVFSNTRIEIKKLPFFQQTTILRGKGKILIGEQCMFGTIDGGFNRNGTIEFQARYKDATITIGDNVATNNNIFICAANKIEIGNHTLIGQNVTLMDFEAHGIEPLKRREVGEVGEIVIGKNVWIGNNVLVLKDSHIGDNSIIAAGAVVKGRFPENVIIGGVPAKIIKHL